MLEGECCKGGVVVGEGRRGGKVFKRAGEKKTGEGRICREWGEVRGDEAQKLERWGRKELFAGG
ncbi:protein of unknown function [Bartonella clarridgeiae 73]|uniref:Uncharacterized protein n=1 Tax=Bartonella clarridgeiae (strain CCUG 45776 / CIP 104772 / 73) TaxID=696125 RepID=E6YJ24_BARC7|nr:hypothetical protein [Bartonella clarridgeiae]WCR55903.1 MAG: hypothetical protein PG977_001296 [Bartonella clarridgeiae]CBI76862.1 protein of unknown function [Bartonella clarridgeiae 73]